MLHFLTDDTSSSSGTSLFTTLIFIGIMIVIFYFLLIRPENKRKKEAEKMRSSMQVGDKITTIGGITGKIVDLKEEHFVLETGADQVRIEFTKWALSTNESAIERAKEETKKAQEAVMRAKAEKKAAKGKKAEKE